MPQNHTTGRPPRRKSFVAESEASVDGSFDNHEDQNHRPKPRNSALSCRPSQAKHNQGQIQAQNPSRTQVIPFRHPNQTPIVYNIANLSVENLSVFNDCVLKINDASLEDQTEETLEQVYTQAYEAGRIAGYRQGMEVATALGRRAKPNQPQQGGFWTDTKAFGKKSARKGMYNVIDWGVVKITAACKKWLEKRVGR